MRRRRFDEHLPVDVEDAAEDVMMEVGTSATDDVAVTETFVDEAEWETVAETWVEEACEAVEEAPEALEEVSEEAELLLSEPPLELELALEKAGLGPGAA